jgi:hypothetical protein
MGPAADSKELMVVVEISDAELVLDAMDSLGGGVDVERMVHKAGPTFSFLKYAHYWYLNSSFCIVLTLVLPKHPSP